MEHRLVQLLVEESSHYPVAAPEAHLEWLWTAPEGNEDVHLGPENRVFIVAMLHELHCLRSIRAAAQEGIAGDDEHLQHCFNYLRKWILCSADVTLEPGDFRSRNFEEDRLGAVHICRDWELIYGAIEQNWLDWKLFKDKYWDASAGWHIMDDTSS